VPAPATSTTSSGRCARAGSARAEVSRLVVELDVDLDAFRERGLDEARYPYLWLDAQYEKVRDGGRIVNAAFLVVIATNERGERETGSQSSRGLPQFSTAVPDPRNRRDLETATQAQIYRVLGVGDGLDLEPDEYGRIVRIFVLLPSGQRHVRFGLQTRLHRAVSCGRSHPLPVRRPLSVVSARVR
jgi:hypothetical protein